MKVADLWTASAFALVLLSACDSGQAPPVATATTTATPEPSATAVPPSFTLTPPSTPTATATAMPTIDRSGPGRCTEAVGCDPRSFSTHRSQESCCDLALSLVGLPFSWCPPQAIDETSGECTQCVAHPCLGLPTRTPTATAEPTPTATFTPPPPIPTETATPTVTATPTATIPAGFGRCSESPSCYPAAWEEIVSHDACCDLALELQGLELSWCPAEAIKPLGGCSQCLYPCEGLPTRTATATATVTLTPSSTPTLSAQDLRIRDVIEFASDSCPPPDNVGPFLTIECSSGRCSFACQFLSGHGGVATLQRFASSGEASAAFDAYARDNVRTELHGLAASFWEGEFPISGVPGGSSHRGVFRSDCWLASAYAYDDTHFLLAPQPGESLELVYERATASGLFAECDLAP